MWFYLALLSAVLAGFRRTGEKRLLATFDHFTVGWAMQLFSLPLALTVLVISRQFINPLTLGLNFWLPSALVTLIFYPLNTWLYYSAIKQAELSKVLPIQSIGPALSAIFALLILREMPSVPAIIAITSIVLGLYVLNLSGNRLHNPLRPFMEHRASLYMLGSTMLVAVFVPIEKVSIHASNPLTYAVTSTIGAAIVLLLMEKKFRQGPRPSLTRYIKPLATTASFQGAAYVAVVYALSIGPVAYVSAVKGSGVLIGALVGIVILKESITITKIAAIGLIGFGMIMLALG